MPRSDLLVIGAGVVGAACAYFAARAGLAVTVVDRGSVAGGTTGAGEGNLLVSDKEPGPELDLALLSARLWRELATELGNPFEYEAKGGLVVAATAPGLHALHALVPNQRGAGVEAVAVAPEDLPSYEPHLVPGLAGGMYYPQDAQVQPMLAAAHLLRAARERHGVRVRTGVEVTGIIRESNRGTGPHADATAAGIARGDDRAADGVVRGGERVTGVRSDAGSLATGFVGEGGRVVGVRTDAGDISAGVVVNAAGTWGGEIAAMAGVDLPVLPRRGFILVTEPLPRLIRHKVYAAEYVANVASDSAGLETSAVVEGTQAGMVLIGASRERVGFDRTLSLPVLRRLAAQAVELFPVLRDVSAIRAYCGFRPYCPDHLPVIGEDPHAPGLLHACGHEGAGIGLAAATGHLLAQLITDRRPDCDLAPFRPGRFSEATTV